MTDETNYAWSPENVGKWCAGLLAHIAAQEPRGFRITDLSAKLSDIYRIGETDLPADQATLIRLTQLLLSSGLIERIQKRSKDKTMTTIQLSFAGYCATGLISPTSELRDGTISWTDHAGASRPSA